MVVWFGDATVRLALYLEADLQGLYLVVQARNRKQLQVFLLGPTIWVRAPTEARWLHRHPPLSWTSSYLDRVLCTS